MVETQFALPDLANFLRIRLHETWRVAVTPEDLATLERFLVIELSASRLEAVVEGARADVV